MSLRVQICCPLPSLFRIIARFNINKLLLICTWRFWIQLFRTWSRKIYRQPAPRSCVSLPRWGWTVPRCPAKNYNTGIKREICSRRLLKKPSFGRLSPLDNRGNNKNRTRNRLCFRYSSGFIRVVVQHRIPSYLRVSKGIIKLRDAKIIGHYFIRRYFQSRERIWIWFFSSLRFVRERERIQGKFNVKIIA